LQPAEFDFSWKKQTTFIHPSTKRVCSWVIEKKDGDNWQGLGCWLCAHSGAKSSFARVTVQSIHSVSLKSLQDHQKSKEHALALSTLQASAKPADVPAVPEAPVSGLSSCVPRLDKFAAVVNSITNHCSFESHKATTQVMSLGSSLEAGFSGKEESKKIIVCLDGPLQDRLRRALSQTVVSSIALDKSDDVLVAIVRLLLPTGIYDAVLGLQTDVGAETADVANALDSVIRRACTKRDTRRDAKASVVVEVALMFDVSVHVGITRFRCRHVVRTGLAV
jgi:hypothetical protein